MDDNTRRIRRERLKQLIAAKFGTEHGAAGRFADALGKRRPSIYRLFSDADSGRGIGEDLAREIEQKFRKPRGWLDRAR